MSIEVGPATSYSPRAVRNVTVEVEAGTMSGNRGEQGGALSVTVGPCQGNSSVSALSVRVAGTSFSRNQATAFQGGGGAARIVVCASEVWNVSVAADSVTAVDNVGGTVAGRRERPMSGGAALAPEHESRADCGVVKYLPPTCCSRCGRDPAPLLPSTSRKCSPVACACVSHGAGGGGGALDVALTAFTALNGASVSTVALNASGNSVNGNPPLRSLCGSSDVAMSQGVRLPSRQEVCVCGGGGSCPFVCACACRHWRRWRHRARSPGGRQCCQCSCCSVRLHLNQQRESCVPGARGGGWECQTGVGG